MLLFCFFIKPFFLKGRRNFNKNIQKEILKHLNETNLLVNKTKKKKKINKPCILPIENKLNMQKRPMKYNILHFRSIESIKQAIILFILIPDNT